MCLFHILYKQPEKKITKLVFNYLNFSHLLVDIYLSFSEKLWKFNKKTSESVFDLQSMHIIFMCSVNHKKFFDIS